MAHPPRGELLRAIKLVEVLIRTIASSVHLPGQDRTQLLQVADMLASLLTQAGMQDVTLGRKAIRAKLHGKCSGAQPSPVSGAD
jgi:hypothetical protein